MSNTTAFAQLVERGCLCGTDRIAECALHGPGDNRGIAAHFKAGMPNGFPLVATCTLCRAEGLLYPSVPLDKGEVPAGEAPSPTLICPCCSCPALEDSLRREAEDFGYQLNDRRVFPAPMVAAA